MSPNVTPKYEGGPIPSRYPFTGAVFNSFKTMREAEHKLLIGQLLTFVESLFDAGQRCEAAKQQLKNIIFSWREGVEQNTRNLSYSIALSIDDVDLAETLHRDFGAFSIYPALPRLTEFVGELTGDRQSKEQ